MNYEIMETGNIIKLDFERKFGFIKLTDGKSVYFKTFNAPSTLKVGDRVSFEYEPNTEEAGKPRAIKITIVEEKEDFSGWNVGYVKNKKESFGFISSYLGGDYFFHFKECRNNCWTELKERSYVFFQTISTPKGLSAVKVTQPNAFSENQLNGLFTELYPKIKIENIEIFSNIFPDNFPNKTKILERLFDWLEKFENIYVNIDKSILKSIISLTQKIASERLSEIFILSLSKFSDKCYFDKVIKLFPKDFPIKDKAIGDLYFNWLHKLEALRKVDLLVVSKLIDFYKITNVYELNYLLCLSVSKINTNYYEEYYSSKYVNYFDIIKLFPIDYEGKNFPFSNSDFNEFIKTTKRKKNLVNNHSVSLIVMCFELGLVNKIEPLVSFIFSKKNIHNVIENEDDKDSLAEIIIDILCFYNYKNNDLYLKLFDLVNVSYNNRIDFFTNLFVNDSDFNYVFIKYINSIDKKKTKQYYESYAQFCDSDILDLFSIGEDGQVVFDMDRSMNYLENNGVNTLSSYLISQVIIKNSTDKINVSNEIYELANSFYKLKFWLYGFVDENKFDYFTFWEPYYNLWLNEQKLFKKKSSQLMEQLEKNKVMGEIEPAELISELENNQLEYIVSWKNILFEDEYIKICIDEGEFTRPFSVKSSRGYNYYRQYLKGRRLDPFKIIVDSNLNILNTVVPEELAIIINSIYNENINHSSTNNYHESDNYNIQINLPYPINQEIRSECIDWLNKLQMPNLKPATITEIKQTLEFGFKFDGSNLYSIDLNNGEIAIIWESYEHEKSKATYLFKCSKENYEVVFANISKYLSSTFNVRSKTRSNSDTEELQKLHYIGAISHDNENLNTWKNKILDKFPELKSLEN